MVISSTVTVGTSCVRVVGAFVKQVIASKLFVQWCNRIDGRFALDLIEVQSVDFVLRNGKKEILFIKLKVTYYNNDKKIVRIAHLRGGAVILFVLLVCDDSEYVVTVSEERLPAGIYESIGLPAGMLDGNNDALSVAVKELKEETGIKLVSENFINMTEKFYGQGERGVDVSRGGSDEYYQCFFSRLSLTREALNDLHGRVAGAVEEHERTVVGVVPISQLLHLSPQASTFIAYGLYKELHL